MAGNQYAIVYDASDGQAVIFEVAYLSSQISDALARCKATHPDCNARSIRADLIGTS